MKSIRRTWDIIKINGREIILFEIFYRIVTNVIFLSLFTRGMTFAVKKSGYSYLTAKNIGWFLLKPATLPVLAGIGLVGIIFILIETCCLLSAYQAGERGEKLTAHEIFFRGLVKSVRFLNKKNWLFLFMNLLLAAAFNYDLIARGILHVKPLNDVVRNMKQNMIAQTTAWGILLVLVLVMIPCLFTVHFCILDKRNGKEALAGSVAIMKKHGIFAILQTVILNVLTLLVIRGLLYVLTFLTAVIIGTFVDKSITLALFLTAYDWLELGSVVFGGIVGVVLNFALLSGMYYYYRDKEDMAPELLISEEENRLQNQTHRRTRQFILATLSACCLLFLYDVITNGISFAREVLIETQITAHRGSSMDAPENTLPAIQLAIDQMADFVEIDVQETSDGEIILLHDKSFKRTCGVNRQPSKMTYEEIKLLDAGSYMGEEYKGTQVPTLAQVLALCKGKINLNIELKNNGSPNLPEKVAAMVEEFGMEEQCVFTSTSLAFLTKVKEYNEDLKTGYILSTAYGNIYDTQGVDFLSVNYGLVNAKGLETAHENGLEVHVWTVNSKTVIERMKRLGVDNIITDYPVLVREILYREKDTENFLEFMKMVIK